MSIFHRFTGKPVDSTRLYYYGERFYGPGTVWKSLSQIYGRDNQRQTWAGLFLQNAASNHCQTLGGTDT